MHFADSSRGRPLSKDPSVAFYKDQYFMYYSLGPWVNGVTPPAGIDGSGWSIGIATSLDLTHWTKVGELLPESNAERKGLCAPGARVIGEKLHLFYQTYGNGPKDAICHATSEDGISFQRNPTNPIYRPEGSWTNGRAIDAEAHPVGDRLLLYYATRDLTGTIQKIGVASAPLDSDYSREQWHTESIGSVLAPELDWERKCIKAATLIQHEKVLWMFYAGGYNNEPQQIGVAFSNDGLTWRRHSEQPFLPHGAAGSWNSSESGHHRVIQVFFKTRRVVEPTCFFRAITTVESPGIYPRSRSLGFRVCRK